MRAMGWVVFLLLAAGSALAQSNAQGLALCNEIGSAVRLLVKYTNTECTYGANQDGGLDLILVAVEPVFAVKASRDAWLVVAVGATAQATHTSPAKTGRVILSDRTMIAQARGFALPTATARTIQSRMKAGELDLAGAVAEIDAALVPYAAAR